MAKPDTTTKTNGDFDNAVANAKARQDARRKSAKRLGGDNATDCKWDAGEKVETENGFTVTYAGEYVSHTTAKTRHGLRTRLVMTVDGVETGFWLPERWATTFADPSSALRKGQRVEVQRVYVRSGQAVTVKGTEFYCY